MKNKALLLFFSLIVTSITSCMHTDAVPYAFTEPECKIGRVVNIHEFAGIHFTFYNNSDKSIQNFKFTCLLFDSTGEQSPLVGSNIISARYLETIAPNSVKDIVFSLDPYITQIPTDPYIIDFFYVTKIEYNDGSVWEDPYGSFIPSGL